MIRNSINALPQFRRLHSVCSALFPALNRASIAQPLTATPVTIKSARSISSSNTNRAQQSDAPPCCPPGSIGMRPAGPHTPKGSSFCNFFVIFLWLQENVRKLAIWKFMSAAQRSMLVCHFFAADYERGCCREGRGVLVAQEVFGIHMGNLAEARARCLLVFALFQCSQTLFCDC